MGAGATMLMESPRIRETERDAALVERCRAGDESAFSELLHLYRDKAVNLAYGVLGSAEDAQDAAQRAFILVFMRLSDFRGESAFFSWLYRIVINESINMSRGRPRTEVQYDAEIHDREDPRCNPNCREEVHIALRALPVHLRSVLVLREVDQLSYEEIAEVLRIPVGTVRSRLSSARSAFRRKYKELIRDEM